MPRYLILLTSSLAHRLTGRRSCCSNKLPGTPVLISAGDGKGKAEMTTDQGAIYATDNGAYTWSAGVQETVDATLNRTVSSGKPLLLLSNSESVADNGFLVNRGRPAIDCHFGKEYEAGAVSHPTCRNACFSKSEISTRVSAYNDWAIPCFMLYLPAWHRVSCCW